MIEFYMFSTAWSVTGWRRVDQAQRIHQKARSKSGSILNHALKSAPSPGSSPAPYCQPVYRAPAYLWPAPHSS